MKSVNKAIRKKDAMELLLGKPVYMEDIAPKDCLVVKLLRSPYAYAIIKDINTDIAKKFRELRLYIHIKILIRMERDLHVQDRLILSLVHMTG